MTLQFQRSPDHTLPEGNLCRAIAPVAPGQGLYLLALDTGKILPPSSMVCTPPVSMCRRHSALQLGDHHLSLIMCLAMKSFPNCILVKEVLG